MLAGFWLELGTKIARSCGLAHFRQLRAQQAGGGGVTIRAGQTTCLSSRALRCRVWKVRGQVQGVGFRPFVYRLACRLGLSGDVRNDPSGVTIRAFGPPELLDEFVVRLRQEAPALSRIDSVGLVSDEAAVDVPDAFQIVSSTEEPTERGRVTVDSATCSDCLRELFDPADRRYRHGLINCTNCGPRFSIVRDLPYDRPRTTMAGFEMCARCAAEYHDPADRRFHAQPVCCPSCGPQVRMTDAAGRPWVGNPYRTAARLLADDGVLAMKGLGGYHLVVRADREAAVARLRRAKRRDHKPFALMVGDLRQAKRLVRLSEQAERLLLSPVCPIVLAERTAEAEGLVAPSVAPGCHRLGVMLPNTPMQHLLAREPELRGVPLVMTSANLSDDPLIKDDEAALEQLRSLCDGFLWHDRPIERAVDDSVVLDGPCGVVPLRRARGYVPTPLSLPVSLDEPGLCVGGELKNVVAVARHNEVVLSQHVGDLTYSLAFERFRQTLDDLQRLFDARPAWVAGDKHPRYLSRQWGRRLAAQLGVQWHEVQHHHAHLASLLAEHGRTEPVVGLVCDGVGFGDDGTVWGGELLVGGLAHCHRVGRMRPLRLPGGDAAAKQTTRCAAAWLFDLFGDGAVRCSAAARLFPDRREREAIFALLRRGLSCPTSSALGRLFDAAAALLGVCDFNHYEAMAGQRLEAAAFRARGSDVPVFEPRIEENGGCLEWDTRPLLAELLRGLEDGVPTDELALFFHHAVADSLLALALRAVEKTGIRTLGLSGGVFCNAVLTERVVERARAAGLEVFVHSQVPPNDGGLALGQAAVVAARLRGG